MTRKLTTYVTLLDENGDRHTFAPGDDVPAEFAERITNPDVWDGDAPTKEPARGKAEDDDEPKNKGARRPS